jgi:hypothetical protein
MFFKTKKFIQILKDSCGPSKTSRTYRDDEINPLKTPPHKVKKN